VRLYRPFSVEHFMAALPASVKKISVLDRTKEPGSIGEPLYEDVRTAIGEAMETGKAQFKTWPKVVGGRYGLGSCEFLPSMVKAALDDLKRDQPKNDFVLGVYDDLGGSTLEWDDDFSLDAEGTVECVFYGLGSDGTVGANKNSIKIIGDETEHYAQGYFVYDSKKAGTYTISHLRFGPRVIQKPYNIPKADFVACHKFSFMEKLDIIAGCKDGGKFLLNSPFPADKVWDELPVEAQKRIIDKKIKFYVIDGMAIAEKAGMGGRVNTVMQTAFFKISGVLPEDDAVKLVKKYAEKTYIRKGADVVAKNIEAIDLALSATHEVKYPATATSKHTMLAPVPANSPKFVKEVLGELIALRGDKIKTSQMPEDGTFPTGTTKYEKRNIAEKIPCWDKDICIQCGQCTVVCPHAVIRLKAYKPEALAGAPGTFKSADAKGKEFEGMKATLQIAPEDCTGCGACINACPVKDKAVEGRKAINFVDQPTVREEEKKNWDFFLSIPETPNLNLGTIKGIAMQKPLFEFSGACAGCGETPYIKMMTQLFGDRAVIANATGCSSIYGGNLPTTPYTMRTDGRGMRLNADKAAEYARELVTANKAAIGAALADRLLANAQADDPSIETQRASVAELKKLLAGKNEKWAKELVNVSDHLIKRSVWILGGDGWAYDIGFGGLDHVIASGRNVNILVLDTEVYSNTGGQMSKATPFGAVAKFAAAGKDIGKKDLPMIAMSYGYVYVAHIAMGANMNQTLKAFREAESYNGPSIIVAYSHCAMHGIDMMKGMDQQKLLVESGIWPLFRYDPRLVEQGKNPFQIDSKEPQLEKVSTFMANEIRFRTLRAADEARADMLEGKEKAMVERKWKEYRYLADRPF
jgi:pyruvate-ferredoxin/flavodoxin oxidoreductase